MTSVAMTRPFRMASPLDELKYDLIEFGLNIEYFHAAEDRQPVRDRVFSVIQEHSEDIQIDTLIVEKRKTGPALRDEVQFYPRMIGYLLQYPLERKILGNYRVEDLEEIVVITDSIPVKKKRKVIEKSVKLTLKNILPNTRTKVMHHAAKSSFELQIADYCNWAVFRKWERKDERSYALIKERIRSEFDIFRMGTILYY